MIDSAGDSKTLFAVANELLGNDHKVVLPDLSTKDELTYRFSEYFVHEIELIQENIDSVGPDELQSIAPDPEAVELSEFILVTSDRLLDL